jgi:hypothetical protein
MNKLTKDVLIAELKEAIISTANVECTNGTYCWCSGASEGKKIKDTGEHNSYCQRHRDSLAAEV